MSSTSTTTMFGRSAAMAVIAGPKHPITKESRNVVDLVMATPFRATVWAGPFEMEPRHLGGFAIWISPNRSFWPGLTVNSLRTSGPVWPRTNMVESIKR